MTKQTRRTFVSYATITVAGAAFVGCAAGNGSSQTSSKEEGSSSGAEDSTSSTVDTAATGDASEEAMSSGSESSASQDNTSGQSTSSTQEDELSSSDQASSTQQSDSTSDTSTQDSSDMSDISDVSDTSDSTTTDATTEEEIVCRDTVPQTAGPYPAAGLERENLDLYGHDGTPFFLAGTVVDSNCEPIADAKVLIWHATPNPRGTKPKTVQEDPSYKPSIYDHPSMSGEQTPAGSPKSTVPTGDQMYYGWVRTDEKGRYKFQTKRPGWYLNGATYRCTHIHAKIYLPGSSQETITTQIYFPDDPYNGSDSIYQQCTSAAGGECMIRLADVEHGRFDFQV